MTARLADLPHRFARGERAGITSVCSAHPVVIEAALRLGAEDGSPVVIEATCNQVNQDGGYTGMTPAVFRAFVDAIADRTGFPRDRLILGGDHLGPNPWKHLPPADALGRARAMVDAYIRAGFTKIHLDTSMGCAGEPAALSDALTAERAADLATVAEAAADLPPVYVIGTEVPVPGGATESLDHLEVTSPAAAIETVAVHRRAFAARGLDAAFARAIAAVVQPGVEFGNDSVAVYRPDAARALSGALSSIPDFVFEAHSTDYQPPEALAALVRDGFAILKVGPALTFTLREALYGLDHVAATLDGEPALLQQSMEEVMTANPLHWQKYLHGTPADLRRERHFGYSDRIRYYWPEPRAQIAVDRLLARLHGRRIPEVLVSQYLGALYPDVASGQISPEAGNLAIAAVQRILKQYRCAVTPLPGAPTEPL
jgi:D-tagatose-bisphosphate aldolase class II non-catalytic subunit